MEGYRIIDEWPIVRRKITSSAMTFERLKELDPATARAEGRRARDGESAALGKNEWRVYELAGPGESVERIADRSRLGEFEASKALFNLVNLGVLRAVPPAQRSAAAEVEAYARSWKERVRRGAAGVLATVAIAVALATLASSSSSAAERRGRSALRPSTTTGSSGSSPATRWSGCGRRWRCTGSRTAPIRRAWMRSSRPAWRARATSAIPWCQAYAYRRQGSGYLLAPPVE